MTFFGLKRPHGNDLNLGLQSRGGGGLTLSREARGKHLYIVGSTGSGKSKLMEWNIRQDIVNWPNSHCGVIVLDPHGALFDSLMSWLAAKGLRHLPIVPIDLRRGDWIVSYNVLRKRPVGDPSVIVGSLARAILHAWGQENMDQTPRLGKWLPVVLGTLYERGYTLLDSLHLFRSVELRRAMIAEIKGFVTRIVWDIAEPLRPAEFHEEVSSTVNRLLRFVGTQVMRAMLCQAGPSLDLGEAIEKGSIILVSMATAGNQIDDEDARTFGSILLSDLWTAAKSRGKQDERAGGLKPFYAYIDEFQEYVTPVMAQTLDQARGFGLHFTLAHQFPSQLAGKGENGKLVFNSVMANARSKICFQIDHPEDLPMLALWMGRGQIDVDAVKHQHYSTKVLGYDLAYLPSYHSATSVGQSEGQTVGTSTSSTSGGSAGHSHGISHSLSIAQGTGVTSGESWLEDGSITNEDTPYTASEGRSTSESEGITDTESESWSESSSWGESNAESESRSTSSSTSQSDGISHAPMLIPIMGQEALPPQFRSVEEQIFSFTQLLAGQPDRHAVARLAGEQLPTPFRVPEVVPGLITPAYTRQYTSRILAALPYALPMEEANRRLAHHEATFADNLLAPLPLLEPSVLARKVPAKILPPAESKPKAAKRRTRKA